jgi:Mg-chelatase subunit ChlD
MVRAVLLALLASLTAGCASRPLVENVDTGGRSLVLLLDASASMADNDPGRAAVEGAALAVALTGRRDNVGVIAYNANARVVVPLRPSGAADSREAIRAALDGVGTQGSTDFGVALDAAETMLDRAKAPAGSSVIILTDGLPTGRVSRLREFARPTTVNLAIPEAVARLARHGWRIFAIVFGPEAAGARSYLAQLVGPTGGSVIEAKDASGLLAAFEAVSVQALGYLSADRLGDAESVRVVPGMRRLAVLGRFEDRGDLGAVSREGKAVAESELVRFPRRAPFAVALLEDPAPGSYQVQAGGATGGLLLLEPGWTLELDPQAPPSVVVGGSRVPVAVRVQGDAAALARVNDSLRLELEVKRAEKVLARVPLARWENEVRFEGAFLAPPEEEPLTVTAIATVSEAGKSFEERRSVAISVRKGGKAATAQVRLGFSGATFTAFEGQELEGSVTLEGDPEVPLVVSVETPPGFAASPARIELSPKARATVAVHGNGTATSGTLIFSVTPALAGLAPFRREAPLAVVRGHLPDPIDLGTVAPGERVSASLEARNVLFVAKPPLAIEATRLVLDAKNLAPGPFAGTIEARCGGSSRTVSVRAKVARRPPERLELRASWGWLSTTIDAGPDATLKLEPLINEATHAHIEPAYDMRVVGAGEGRFELRILVPTSLPEGLYVGSVTIDGGDQSSTIPVALEVKR